MGKSRDAEQFQYSRPAPADQEALGQALELLRPYLCILARRQLDGALDARVDPSDIVQQTCLEASRDYAAFRGATYGQLIGWLRKILNHNAAQTIAMHCTARKRSVRREQSLAGIADGRPAWAQVPSEHSSPSRRAMQGELAVRLAQEVENLPEDQREAVRLRHVEGLALAQIAARFGRSETAVAGLIKRGLRALRQQLTDVQEGHAQ